MIAQCLVLHVSPKLLTVIRFSLAQVMDNFRAYLKDKLLMFEKRVVHTDIPASREGLEAVERTMADFFMLARSPVVLVTDGSSYGEAVCVSPTQVLILIRVSSIRMQCRLFASVRIGRQSATPPFLGTTPVVAMKARAGISPFHKTSAPTYWSALVAVNGRHSPPLPATCVPHGGTKAVIAQLYPTPTDLSPHKFRLKGKYRSRDRKVRYNERSQ